MSTPTHSHEPTGADTGGRELLLRPLRAIGFWSAITLPFVYVPLALGGLETATAQQAVAILIGAHVLALILGHRYQVS
ncbi:MAG: hypothetical protein ACOCP3_03655 [Halodesulfurarchaeum sp.]